MRSWITAGLAVLVLTGLAGASLPRAGAQTEPVWLPNYAAAQAAAQREAKPIFLVFR